MAVNLSRNTKVFFSTVTTNTLADYTSSNTFELQVLDGYSFSQTTEQQTISLSEAGTAPVRGERAFNSLLNPAEWSLSTYIRPYKDTNVTAPEKFLWNAAMGSTAIDTTGIAVSGSNYIDTTKASIVLGSALFTGNLDDAKGQMISIRGITSVTSFNNSFKVLSVSGTGSPTQTITFETITDIGTGTPGYTSAKVYKGQWVEDTTKAITSSIGSNRNQLQNFTLIFKVDNTVYKIDSCAVNQAEIQFDLQGISMIAWSGFGTVLSSPANLQAWDSTNYLAFPIAADNYITNKLSTTTLVSNIKGTAGTTYSLPITGGSLTLNNNITYLTPENMGVVNNSIGYFTGARSINGSLNAYLKTGALESATLLTDILSGLTTTSETKFKLQIEVGGASNTTRVELLMDACQLQVPTVDIQDVVSTTINFTAQGYADTEYDIERTNNLVVTYYGVV
jgi:hypothetical protein